MISEPIFRVVPETPFDLNAKSKLKGIMQILGERLEAVAAPGKGLGLNTLRDDKSKAKISDIRARHPEEIAIPTAGVTKNGPTFSVVDIPNPDSPDGTWDPFQYAPNFHFDGREDSFPVRPGYDGDLDVTNDARNYDHGVVGGDQAVQMNFSVAKKGEFYVLQYNSYYVDNKVASGYHDGDWSTVSVYLKPGQDGKLKPAYMYTSWHHGGIMTPWEDLLKDANGRPSVDIGRGSHSVVPISNCVKPKADGGLVAYGDGRLAKRGSSRDLPNRLTFNSVQGNIRQAEKIDLSSTAGQHSLDVYFGHTPDRMNPYHPSLYYSKQRLLAGR